MSSWELLESDCRRESSVNKSSGFLAGSEPHRARLPQMTNGFTGRPCAPRGSVADWAEGLDESSPGPQPGRYIGVTRSFPNRSPGATQVFVLAALSSYLVSR